MAEAEVLPAILRPPEGLPEGFRPGGLSNCDFTVDEGVEEALKAGSCWTRYAGWNFNAMVWWDADVERFRGTPMTYGSANETHSAETLDALMHSISSEYGYD